MERLLEVTAAAEDRHFWFIGLRRFARTLLDAALPGRRPVRVLDCGSGTGRNLDWLNAYGWAAGVELSPAGLAVGRRHGRRMMRGTVAALPVPAGAFDVVTSFDVLYALDDDTERAALREMHRALAPGGLLLVNVAALDILTGRHAALAHERRRYTTPRLRARLEDAGFEVIRMSYTNAVTLPLTLAVRLAQRCRGSAAAAGEQEMTVPPAPLNAVLAGLLRMEAWIVGRWSLPAGSSLMAVARKR